MVIESNEDHGNWLQFTTKDTKEAGLLFGSSTSSAHGAITHTNNNGMTFRTGNNNTRMVIDEDGNVKINSGKLYLPGTQSATTGEIIFSNFSNK